MDDLLRKIVTESESSKLTQIVSQSHQAIEILCDKMSLMRFPMNEIRDKCFQVFQSCLSNGSKNAKLIQLSVTGMQLMIRNQIYWSVECKEDEKQLPSQLIECISTTISLQNESIQMEMLSILSEMSLTIPSLISLDNIEDIIEICCKLSFQSPKHQMAIEATASQSCHQFLKYCLNSEPPIDSCVDEEIIPLLDLIINKLKFSQNTDNIAVLLKCVHYFFITIPDEWPLINDIIVDIVWKTLIPTLIKHLSPIDMSECSSKSLDSSTQSTDGKQLGRGSESLNKKQNFNHKKTIFKITSELLRLFGRISSLRPALESLFHRILLYPPVPQRLEALKWIQEIFKKTSLVVIASIEPLECFGKSSRSKDLDLLHIILDSLEECSLSSDPQICLQSITAVVIFLRCLQTICNSFDLKSDITEQIDRLYPTLIDSDFEGFDVRKTKFQSFESKDYFETQTKVSLEILKKRIIGFDASEEPLESSDQTPDPPKKQTNDESIRKSLRNFKVEAYKSKLKEILGSKSTDSNTDSQDIDVLNRDNYNENKDKDYVKQESIPMNGVNEEVVKETTKLGSRSTSYEEVEEYRSQKSLANSNSSFTEGPEYEDCVEQIYEKRDSQQMADFPQNDIESIHYERNNARRFISALKIFLPKLLSLRTSIEADQALQLFASNYCTDLFEHQKCISNTNQSNESCMSYKTIINADGIYLSTYSTLLLNLKLIHSNFYNNSSATIPLTEQEFIEELHSSGILIYISSYWLAELYQRVLSDNLLENAGYKPLNSNIALINLLTDIDGLDSFQPGAQQLSDYRRLEKAVNHSLYLDITQCAATHKLVRRLLTAFWDTILGCLGTVFKVEGNTNELSNAIAINSLLGNDKSINIKKEMITMSLDGLQMSAKLCIQLGLQSRCDTVFELLALSVIETKSQTNETLNKKIKQIRRSVIEVIRNRQPFSLHSSHVLSLQVLLSCSLEIGSHCTACWRYVFKCCQYIMELENHYFTSRHSSLLSSTRTSISSLIKSTNKQTSDFYTNFSTNIDSPSMPGINESEELNTQSCIEQLIAETNSHSTDSVLKDKQLERVIDILSHLVDLLFEDAANKLNLRSLHSFLTELCVCSGEQLNFLNKLDENSGSLKSLLLFRLSDVMLRCAKSGRPLMHFMKCWSVVSSHLVEAATHSDHSVAKKSITTLHDIINVILCSHNELPHFHFNEALFKPFENLLLLELCDTDIQELIISSICEFVEGTTEEIRSGWRSLFGALRGIRLPQICRNSDNSTELEVEKARQLRVILDIFEAFLHTDNLQVFANAALDCLLCLIKLIKTQQIITNQTNCDESNGTEYPDLCLISLKYLDQFSSMLRSMYQMPGCPIFSNSRVLRSNCPESKLIDTTNLPDVKPLVIEVSLERLDRTVRILQIWFILVEEFTQAIEKCEQKHRNTAIEILFNWFKSLFEIPGPNFAIYCINHILMPFLQRMTRQTLNNQENNITGDQISLSTLRHLYGLTADLVVSGIQLLNTDSNGYDLSHSTLFGLDLMLKQSLLVYIECLNGKYNESVAKLSCACIRHILLSVRTHFDHNLWQTTIDCLWTGHKITLQSLEDMVNVFTNKSQYFFDDFDQIQVISKRDPKEDSEQLSRLAQQIFLLDAQRNCPNFQNKWSTSDCSHNLLPVGDNRSFIFLINSSNNNRLTISFRELIIQLTCHWLLLQTISVLIMSGIEPLLPNLNKLIDSSHQILKPTVLSMDINQCQSVLSLLDHSYRIAFNFDSKLGLKFLMQKISRCEVPTNLYQFSSLVWSVRFVVNLFIINDENLSNDFSKNDLKQSLSDLCDRYSEQMKDNDSNEITIDDICHQSLHFLQASNEELMNIIGNKHLIEIPNTTKEETIVGNNVNQIDGKEEVEEEQKKCVTDSDEERAETPDNSIKIYSLATEKKIDSMVAEYKKYKTQFSPIPPNANSSQPLKKPTNEKMENTTEKDSQKVALKDCQAFTALWSEIIGYAIDLHMSLPLDRFNQLVPMFLPSVQSLIINCNNKYLRSRISQWITRIAENCLKNNEINA